MSLIDLYNKKNSAFAPPDNQDVYETEVFKNESKGVNDLVMKYEQADLFRPPQVTDTYIAKVFAEGVVTNSI